MADSIRAIRELLPELSPRLFAKPNVVATGLGYKRVHGKKTGELCIICSVDTKVASSSLLKNQSIPAYIAGIPTDVNPVGPVHSLQLPTGKFRPVPGGVSIGHIHVTAGTAGCLVKRGEKIFVLSNNHVLANSNKARPGDMIIQPALHDGGVVSLDQVARLSEFVEIHFESENDAGNIAGGFTRFFNFFARISGSRSRIYSRRSITLENFVDCAIAEPVNESDFLNEILQIGEITGLAEGTLGMKIRKSGRTTGLTSGSIDQVDVTVRVNYGTNRTALFTDQLVAGAMSQGGDSGSAVLSEDNKIVGLLFAGSTSITILNRIQHVFRLLEVTLV